MKTIKKPVTESGKIANSMAEKLDVDKCLVLVEKNGKFAVTLMGKDKDISRCQFADFIVGCVKVSQEFKALFDHTVAHLTVGKLEELTGVSKEEVLFGNLNKKGKRYPN